MVAIFLLWYYCVLGISLSEVKMVSVLAAGDDEEANKH